MIQAFDEKDDDRMKAIIKNYLTYAVDNEFLKMINKIIKSDEWTREARQVQEQNNKTHISNMTDSYHTKPKNLPDSGETVTTSNQSQSQNQQPAVTTAAAVDEDDEELDLR